MIGGLKDWLKIFHLTRANAMSRGHRISLFRKWTLFLLTALGLTPYPWTGFLQVRGLATTASQAWASTHYGIKGRIAPELDLKTWIDGSGQAMPPIRLSDFRGQVVYLYFFQNW